MFQRSGEVGADLLKVDWDATPLGPLEKWPRSLESVVRLVLTSRFSMWMCWGPELTFLCNEAYRRDTLGEKYPWALGKPAAVVWSEIWDDIEDRVRTVLKDGEATWDESLMLFLERSGYTEETYHTFSYSPLFDDDGAVAGLLCVVSEDTDEVIARRRLQTLGDLGTRRASDLTEAEATATACEVLGDNGRDLPFSLVYLADADGDTAHLACRTGFRADDPAAPAALDLTSGEGPWPSAAVMSGEAQHLTDLATRFRHLPTGDWDQPPTQALC